MSTASVATKKADNNKINFYFRKEMYKDFLNKISELAKIENKVRLKIDKDSIFLYTTKIAGESKQILAFKNYSLSTEEYFDIHSRDLLGDNTIDMIIGEAKKFVSQSSLLTTKDNLKGYITIEPSKDNPTTLVGKNIWMHDGILKIAYPSTPLRELKNIDNSIISHILSQSQIVWDFTMIADSYDKVRKLSTMNKDSEIVKIYVKEGGVYFSDEQGTWEYKVCETTHPNQPPIFFQKSNFGLVNKDDFEELLMEAQTETFESKNPQMKIDFYILPKNILFRTPNSNLLVAVEV